MYVALVSMDKPHSSMNVCQHVKRTLKVDAVYTVGESQSHTYYKDGRHST
jgi:hypothetical protein